MTAADDTRVFTNNLFTIYTFRAPDGTALYVGQSIRFPDRLDEHQHGTHAKGSTWKRRGDAKTWFRDAATVHLDHVPAGGTQADADALEQHLIRTLRPLYNIDHNPDAHLVPQRVAAAHARLRVDLDTAQQARQARPRTAARRRPPTPTPARQTWQPAPPIWRPAPAPRPYTPPPPQAQLHNHTGRILAILFGLPVALMVLIVILIGLRLG